MTDVSRQLKPRRHLWATRPPSSHLLSEAPAVRPFAPASGCLLPLSSLSAHPRTPARLVVLGSRIMEWLESAPRARLPGPGPSSHAGAISGTSLHLSVPSFPVCKKGEGWHRRPAAAGNTPNSSECPLVVTVTIVSEVRVAFPPSLSSDLGGWITACFSADPVVTLRMSPLSRRPTNVQIPLLFMPHRWTAFASWGFVPNQPEPSCP